MRILQVKEYVGTELELVSSGYVALETNSPEEQRKAEIYNSDLLDFGTKLSGVQITYEGPFQRKTTLEDSTWDPDSSRGWSTPRTVTRLFQEVPLEERNL
jgi:hypothetical protein